MSLDHKRLVWDEIAFMNPSIDCEWSDLSVTRITLRCEGVLFDTGPMKHHTICHPTDHRLFNIFKLDERAYPEFLQHCVARNHKLPRDSDKQ